MTNVNRYPAILPGEILLEEFLEPLQLGQNKLARAIGVSPGRINEIVKGKRAITPETALRLSVFFGNTAEFWMNLQTQYDLKTLRQTCGDEIRRTVQPLGHEAA